MRSKTAMFSVIFVSLMSILGCSEETSSVGAKARDMMPTVDMNMSELDAGFDVDAAVIPATDAMMADMGEMPEMPLVIQRIQQGLIADGTSVTVTNAVVVATAGDDGFFIADGSEEAYSGIYVYHPGTASLGLRPGLLVTLVGLVKEYFDLTEIVMNADAEVLIVGEAPTPNPAYISADDLCNADTLEPWEGVLISLDNVRVDSVGEFGGFVVTNRSEACALAVNPLISPIELGRIFRDQNLARVTGVLHYAFESFQLLPRDREDIITVPLATGVVTIPEIRDGDVPIQSRVSLQGVTVIAADEFFVYLSDSAGGPRSAIRVTDRQRDVAFTVGDRVDVDLLVLSQLTGRLIQAQVVGRAIGPSPRVVTEAEVSSEDYLYTLVQFNDAVVSDPSPSIMYIDTPNGTSIYGNPRAAFDTGSLTVGKEFFESNKPFLRVGDRFSQIVGVRTEHAFEVLENEQAVERVRPAISPRSDDDLVGYQPYCDSALCAGDLEPGDLVITEIFYGGDCEWIELHNTRADSIDLTHVQIGERDSSAAGSRPFTFGNNIIRGGQFVIVGCRPDCDAGFDFIASTLGGALANAGDTIEVWAGDMVLDTVTYEPGRTDGIQLQEGVVTGDIGSDIATENDNASYWCDAVTTEACGNSGTPGRLNECTVSCAPDRCASELETGDLLITELMTDPVGGNSACEWVELYNNTDQTIQLVGLLLVDGEDPNLFRAPNLLEGNIAPGAYDVIIKNAAECQSECQPGHLASWTQHASLNNTSDTITLAFQDRVIDRVSYSEASTNGASTQRIGFGRDVQWCSTSDGGDQCVQSQATPGSANQCP
ncbi:MAG: lamin tail domain-containing protein [Bradymonadia bacterium]